MNTEITSELHLLQHALNSQKQGFEALVKEMSEFTPQPLSPEQKQKMQEMREHFYSLNPDQPTEPIDEFVELQFHPRFQATNLFGGRFDGYWTLIVLSSSALIEAYINHYLALRIASMNLYEIFDDIQAMEIVKKWVIAPRIFISDYKFNKSESLYSDLKRLVKRRNALVHHKVELKIDGKTVLKGSPLERGSIKKEIEFIRKSYSLPRRLLEHLYKYDQSLDVHGLIFLTDFHRDEQAT